MVILRPPEKLVLEVSYTGRYRISSWVRNEGVRGAAGSEFTPSPQSFVHFDEVYFVENTTMADIGRYEITLNPAGQATLERTVINVIAPGTHVL